MNKMMIADEKQAQIDALNEMSGDSPIYVVHGARMICSMGSRVIELRVVLAAPDIDVDVFKAEMRVIGRQIVMAVDEVAGFL